MKLEGINDHKKNYNRIVQTYFVFVNIKGVYKERERQKSTFCLMKIKVLFLFKIISEERNYSFSEK
jgi:hypothetical protein